MNHQAHKDLQDQILRQTLDILKTDAQVLGVVTTGSFVKGENDAFSDIDVDCYMNSEVRTGIKNIIGKVLRIAPVLAHLWVYDKNALFLFENGVRLDLNFNKPSEIPQEKRQNCDILFDPQGALEAGFDKSSIAREHPHPPWTPEDFEYLEWFFWMFRQVYCWTKRAEQQNHKSFNKLTNAVDSLAQIRNGLMGVKLWLHGSWDYMLNVDPQFALRLSKTHPHFEASEVLMCTRLLLQEFRDICKPYCKKRGIEYPTHQLVMLEKMLDAFDKVS